ncbi:hypothetical protein ABC382_00150 [Lysinibacillus sp. 1P01SD]|uniref:hypothetical protein n=1 Tax=Lysinibacillus sp. 1P01SD TaxID=3132285 RepID=UPI0039A1D9B8
MSKTQLISMTELLGLPVGTVFKKGNRKRIFIKVEGFFVFYKVPSKKGETKGENILIFERWMKGAEIIKQEV